MGALEGLPGEDLIRLHLGPADFQLSSAPPLQLRPSQKSAISPPHQPQVQLFCRFCREARDDVEASR
jgi:hypothetical protein